MKTLRYIMYYIMEEAGHAYLYDHFLAIVKMDKHCGQNNLKPAAASELQTQASKEILL